MPKYNLAIVLALATAARATCQTTPATRNGLLVEVVATASEYVPQSTTISRSGHAYTSCLGNTDYFGWFDRSGNLSGSAETRTNCDTTFTPPSESTLTTYRRVNYTIAKSNEAIYLLACTQTWKPTAGSRVRLGIIAVAAGNKDPGAMDRAEANARGKWTECPAFGLGAQYELTVHNTSDARLEDAYGTKPIKLEYLSSATLPAQTPESTPVKTQAVTAAGEARVHVTSSPSGGEIYIDGKFFGNTPSTIMLFTGEHALRVIWGSKVWTRT